VRPQPEAPPLPEPHAENGFCAAYARLLCASFRHWTGRMLVEAAATGDDVGRLLFEAPFAVLAHGGGDDPVFCYGNRTALSLFELSWAELTRLPSRLSAEPDARPERARLLQRVSEAGFIDDYSGVRIARSGRRFRIRRAVVWNLRDEASRCCGQAARFGDWERLD
jgi:hypothetical protein